MKIFEDKFEEVSIDKIKCGDKIKIFNFITSQIHLLNINPEYDTLGGQSAVVYEFKADNCHMKYKVCKGEDLPILSRLTVAPKGPYLLYFDDITDTPGFEAYIKAGNYKLLEEILSKFKAGERFSIRDGSNKLHLYTV